MRSGEDPKISFSIDGHDRIVVGIVCVLIQQQRWLGDSARFVIEIGDEVQQLLILVGRCAAIAEEGLFDFGHVNSERMMVVAVSSQSAAVLVLILVTGRADLVPDAAIAVRFLIERNRAYWLHGL